MDCLSVEMNLMDPGDIPEAVSAGLAEDDVVRCRGMIYFRAGDSVLRCEAGEAGETVIRALTARGKTQTARKGDPWLALVNGDSRGPGAIHGIRDGIRRCLILFETIPGQDSLLGRELWDSLAPMERGDAFTETEPGSIVLIKYAEGLTDDEIAEFAAAVIETVETETGIQIRAGIGASVVELARLKESLRQARQAIAVGSVFQPDRQVFCYRRQAMERLISAVPEETRRQIRKEFLSPEPGKQLNPEMMETIRAFFRNDLNLSTTARELFIHRNTLIYRLDKIRKETGFDLRRFQDAAVFQMISRIPPDEKEN